MLFFCLMAPSHYLHKVWLDIIASIPVHFHRKWARYACKYSVSSFKIKFLKMAMHLLRRDEVTAYIQRDIYHSLLQLTPLCEFAISHMINSMSVSVRSVFCFIAHASLDTELKTVHNIDYRSEIHFISTDTIDANVIFMQAACLHLLIEVSSYDDCVFCCIIVRTLGWIQVSVSRIDVSSVPSWIKNGTHPPFPMWYSKLCDMPQLRITHVSLNLICTTNITSNWTWFDFVVLCRDGKCLISVHLTLRSVLFGVVRTTEQPSKYGQHITITKNNTACTVNTFHVLSRCESHDDSIPPMRWHRNYGFRLSIYRWHNAKKL